MSRVMNSNALTKSEINVFLGDVDLPQKGIQESTDKLYLLQDKLRKLDSKKPEIQQKAVQEKVFLWELILCDMSHSSMYCKFIFLFCKLFVCLVFEDQITFFTLYQ